jgi:hypothetical protein
MKRRAFTIAAILSSLMAVAVAIAWARSYWIHDQVSCGSVPGPFSCALDAHEASFAPSSWPPPVPVIATLDVLTSAGKILLRQRVHHEGMLPPPGARGHGWSSDDNVIPNFSYLEATTGDMQGAGHWVVRQASVPHWALVLLFAAPPAVWLIARRRRQAAG